MKEEELKELHILNVSRTFVEGLLDSQISNLTIKALEVKMEEKDRIAILAERKGLMNIKVILGERQKTLLAKQKKEEEENG